MNVRMVTTDELSRILAEQRLRTSSGHQDPSGTPQCPRGTKFVRIWIEQKPTTSRPTPFIIEE